MPNLSTSQQDELRTAVKANKDPLVVAAYKGGDIDFLASYYGALSAAPAVMVWKQAVSAADLMLCIHWDEFKLLAVDDKAAFQTMLNTSGAPLDFTNANLRGGIFDVYTGKATSNEINALAQRVASRFEALPGFLVNAGNAKVTSAFNVKPDRLDVARALYVNDDPSQPR